jgi:hypothetical protein
VSEKEKIIIYVHPTFFFGGGSISGKMVRRFNVSLREQIYDGLWRTEGVNMVDVLRATLGGNTEKKPENLSSYKNNVFEVGFAVPWTGATERRRAELKLLPIEKKSELLKKLVRLAGGE